MKGDSDSIQKIIETLSPIERRIIPFLGEGTIHGIAEKTKLEDVAIRRALTYLQDKGIVKLSEEKIKIIDLGINGIRYRKTGLPERRLLDFLEYKKSVDLKDAKKQSKLSDNEFKAALGALKKKAMLELKNKRIILTETDIGRKTLEEKFIEELPLKLSSLTPEQKHALESLKNRKDIIEIKERTILTFSITELGKAVMGVNLEKYGLIEQITPEIIKKEGWKGKKFRKYDASYHVPEIFGGKRHFVNQAIDYARKIWTEMGFQEMESIGENELLTSSFWNFDALFTAQDHPVRELQDTFFINKKIGLPDKKLVKAVQQAHEKGIAGSKGWQYSWKEEEAKQLVLRTHTTCLSAQTLYKLSKMPKEKRKGKFFSIGKVFRNETIDWSHGFEFHQTEGIVVGEGLNLQDLLGYLKEFFSKMGFEKVRFAPAYFPYTEPSVEIHVWHPEKKIWLELGGSGIFRPEITAPLLGTETPVLAWGLGFDRIITDYYGIKDLRELYKNNLSYLRKVKYWVK